MDGLSVTNLGEHGLEVEQHIFGFRPPPQWTPDGGRIVFTHRGGIYVVDSNGSGLRRIHGWDNENDRYDSPNISPDGSKIAYLKYHQDWFWEDYHWEIATSALDGSDERTLTNLDGAVGSPSWSPDGHRIAFVSRGAISTMAADGSDLRSIASLSDEPSSSQDFRGAYDLGLPLAWSPDGRWSAFVGGRYHFETFGERRVAMYTIEVDGSDLKKVAEEAGAPAWSPDSTRLAFAKHAWDEEGKVSYAELNVSYAEQLYTIGPDGSDPREIMPLPDRLHWDRIVSWSSDGAEILGGPYVASVDGSVLRVLPAPDLFKSVDWAPIPDHYSQTSWSPDGSRIAIQTTYDATNGSIYRYELYTVARDGSDSRVLVVNDHQHGILLRGGGRPLRGAGR